MADERKDPTAVDTSANTDRPEDRGVEVKEEDGARWTEAEAAAEANAENFPRVRRATDLSFEERVEAEAQRLREDDLRSKRNYEALTGSPLPASTSDPNEIYESHLAKHGVDKDKVQRSEGRRLDEVVTTNMHPRGTEYGVGVDRAGAEEDFGTHTLAGKEASFEKGALDRRAEAEQAEARGERDSGAVSDNTAASDANDRAAAQEKAVNERQAEQASSQDPKQSANRGVVANAGAGQGDSISQDAAAEANRDAQVAEDNVTADS